MLSDTKLRGLRPKERAYKVVDRDGMYAMVLVSGVISFRYNYTVNGRQETLVLGRYGSGGLTLAEARERLGAARKLVADGLSPTQQKRRQKLRKEGEESFGEWAERWLISYRMAESTRDMRRSVYERDLARPFGKLQLHEITHDVLRVLCDKIVARGAPATAVHAREIVMLVFRYAGQRGHEHPNPADKVPPCAIATFQPRDRALSSTEIPWLYEFLDRVQSSPCCRSHVGASETMRL